MKIIFQLLVLFTILNFSSCYSYVDDNTVGYYNPVEGEWNIYTDSGTILHKKIYTSNFDTYFLIIDGVQVSNPDIQHYSISSNNKIIYKRYTQTFMIYEDTLSITNSSDHKVYKYIRQKNNIVQ